MNGLGVNFGFFSVFIEFVLNCKDLIFFKDIFDFLKDSGLSELNSDILEIVILDIGFDWMNFDMGIFLDMDDVIFEVNGGLIEYNG